jgi:hypothetical protein
MNCAKFLKMMSEPNWASGIRLICIKSKNYPLLVSTFFLSKLKTSALQSVSLDCAQVEEDQLKAQLSVSFLGQGMLYCLGDLTAVDAKKHKSLITFLKSYCGPHTIFFYSDEFESKNEQHLTVELHETVASEELKEIATHVFDAQQVAALDLLLTIPSYPLESAFLLLSYVEIMSKPMIAEFKKSWFNKIISPESSLFTLSSLFFSRNEKQFFAQWLAIKDEYVPAFWITFWSEQLFRSSSFIGLMHAGNTAQAKKIAFRLPFTFLKKEWQQYKQTELTRAHDFLYHVDCSLKNGGEPFSLDLFYLKFFLREFKAEPS